MSLFNRILPGHDLAIGETKTWVHAEQDGRTGSRVVATLDEDGALRIDVVEWRDGDSNVIMALGLSATGEIEEIAGIASDSLAPITEFAGRLRDVVAAMELVK